MMPGLPIPRNGFALAVHEASHSVTALVVGVPLIGAVLAPVGDFSTPYGGFASFGAGNWSQPTFAEIIDDIPRGREEELSTLETIPGSLRSYLIVLMAGIVGELRAGFASDIDAGWQDYYHAELLAGEALRKPPYSRAAQRMIRRAEIQASTIINAEWQWIARTAQQLEITRRLTAAEITALRAPAQKRKIA
jgi:hypothetical protein